MSLSEVFGFGGSLLDTHLYVQSVPAKVCSDLHLGRRTDVPAGLQWVLS